MKKLRAFWQKYAVAPAVFLLLQLSVVIYSGAAVCGKLASKQEIPSFKFIAFYALEFVVLAVYAILWQQVIKRTKLSLAYANRALAVVWTLVWAVVFFGEHISLGNVFGVALIILGTVFVNIDSDDQEKALENMEEKK